MDVEINEIPGGIIVAFGGGRFDAALVSKIHLELESLAGQPRGNLYIDLSQVTSMDSSAVGILAFLFKRLSAQRRDLCLVGLRGQPRQLLEFLRIDRVIKTRPRLPVDSTLDKCDAS